MKLSDTPYPPSSVITRLTWKPEVLKLTQSAGDNWPITWVEDDLQITAFGDGNGFDGQKLGLSLGFATVTGDPPSHHGKDFASSVDTPEGGGPSGIKASGLLMAGDILYMFVRNYKPGQTEDYTHSRLAWSTNRGVNWNWADWHFTETFGCPEFVQFGPNYQGARDEFVYIVSQDNASAYQFSPDIVLARVPRGKLANRYDYEFFAGYEAGEPIWSPEIDQRRSIFTDPRGIQRVAMTYNAGLSRYILTASHLPEGSRATHTAALGVFDAPEPWGPWTTVAYDSDWSEGNRTYHHKFPTKWMSADGKVMWLLFSGLDGGYYTFCLRQAKLTTDR